MRRNFRLLLSSLVILLVAPSQAAASVEINCSATSLRHTELLICKDAGLYSTYKAMRNAYSVVLPAASAIDPGVSSRQAQWEEQLLAQCTNAQCLSTNIANRSAQLKSALDKVNGIRQSRGQPPVVFPAGAHVARAVPAPEYAPSQPSPLTSADTPADQGTNTSEWSRNSNLPSRATAHPSEAAVIRPQGQQPTPLVSMRQQPMGGYGVRGDAAQQLRTSPSPRVEQAAGASPYVQEIEQPGANAGRLAADSPSETAPVSDDSSSARAELSIQRPLQETDVIVQKEAQEVQRVAVEPTQAAENASHAAVVEKAAAAPTLAVAVPEPAPSMWQRTTGFFGHLFSPGSAAPNDTSPPNVAHAPSAPQESAPSVWSKTKLFLLDALKLGLLLNAAFMVYLSLKTPVKLFTNFTDVLCVVVAAGIVLFGGAMEGEIKGILYAVAGLTVVGVHTLRATPTPLIGLALFLAKFTVLLFAGMYLMVMFLVAAVAGAVLASFFMSERNKTVAHMAGGGVTGFFGTKWMINFTRRLVLDPISVSAAAYWGGVSSISRARMEEQAAHVNSRHRHADIKADEGRADGTAGGPA